MLKNEFNNNKEPIGVERFRCVKSELCEETTISNRRYNFFRNPKIQGRVVIRVEIPPPEAILA